jgi:5-enolpyruvylshikimate-3-phosphate synthase
VPRPCVTEPVTLRDMRMPADVEADWLTPTARAAVKASVRLPGSKSITNRALILAMLADEPTRIAGPLEARDTALMRAAVSALGASVEATEPAADAESVWTVTPGWRTGRARVDIGNAGTLLRFVPPTAALASADVEVSGDPATTVAAPSRSPCMATDAFAAGSSRWTPRNRRS